MNRDLTAVVKLRHEYAGRPLRTDCKQFDGHTLEFRYGWTMDDDDLYPGEIAWIPVDNDVLGVITWFAGGDLEVISE